MNLRYKTLGTGAKTILMLRGWTRCSDHWMGFEEKLQSPSHRILLVDLPGFGDNNDIALSWTSTIDEFAESLQKLLLTLSIDKIHIFSISLGSMVAIKFACLYPQHCQSLCLLNTSMGGNRKSRIFFNSLTRVLSAQFLKSRSDFYLTLVDTLLSHHPNKALVQSSAKEWQKIDQKYKLSPIQALKQLIAAMRFAPKNNEMAQIKAPCIVLKSLEDKFVPNYNSDFVASRIKGSIIKDIPAAGHEATLEQGDLIAKLYLDFLSAL